MKIGVIGLGSIGLRHAQNLRELGHEVVAYDTDEQKMFAWQHGITPTYDEVTTKVDAIVSASPSSQHIHDLRRAEAYGIPAFIEKPIAMEVTGELHRIIHRAENDGLPIMVGYNLRFHQCVIRTKEWIDQGLVGNRLWASFCCAQHNIKPGYLRDGVIRNWSHEIDLARYLLGPAKCVSAAIAEKPAARFGEDMADLVLAHENGAQSTIHLDYVTAPQVRSFCIVGTKGRIHADLVNRHAYRVSPDDWDESFHAKDSFDENYIAEIQAFLRMAERKPAFGATGRDGLEVLKICDDARKLAGLK